MGHVLTGDVSALQRVCCTACKHGGFAPEQSGLRKQKEKRKEDQLSDNILVFVQSRQARIKEMPIETSINPNHPLDSCAEM